MKLILKFKFLTFLVIVLVIAQALINVFAGYNVRTILDARGKGINQIILVSVYVIIIFIGATLSSYIFKMVFNWYKYKISIHFKKQLAINIATFSYKRYLKKNSGEYIAAFNKNPEIIIGKTILPIFSFVNGLTIFISSSVFIALLNPYLLLWSLLLSLVVFIFPILMQKWYSKSNEKLLKANSDFANVLSLLFQSFKTLFVFSKKFLLVGKINEASITQKKAVLKNQIIVDVITNINSILSVVVQVVIIGISVLYFEKGMAELGAVLAISFLYQPLLNGIQTLVSSIFEILGSKNIYKNFINEFKPTEIKNIKLNQFSKIEIKNYIKKYEDKVLLKVDNFVISNKEKIVLIGPSGCGKSTFLANISNIDSDYEGKILINGFDFKTKAIHNMVSEIAYLDQDSYIFNESILFNITLSSLFDQNKWNQIIKICQLDEFINSKEEKENFVFTENGQNLSGGQKQRIAIARALYSERQILFLDESLSQVDDQTKEKIFNELKNMDKTIIFITHHLTNDFFTKVDKVYDIKNNILVKLK